MYLSLHQQDFGLENTNLVAIHLNLLIILTSKLKLMKASDINSTSIALTGEKDIF